MLACGCRYGLTDIQEYYANTGALKQAATDAQGAPSIPALLAVSQDPVGVAWLAGVDIQPAAAHALPSCQQLQVSLQGQHVHHFNIGSCQTPWVQRRHVRWQGVLNKWVAKHVLSMPHALHQLIFASCCAWTSSPGSLPTHLAHQRWPMSGASSWGQAWPHGHACSSEQHVERISSAV